MRGALIRPVVLLAWIAVFATTCESAAEPPDPAAGVVGLQAGQDVPSFMPWHVSGPHAGKAACPLCVYAQRPSAAVWNGVGGLTNAAKIAAELDRTIAALKPRAAVGYVVLLPEVAVPRESSVNAVRTAFADTPLKHVFLCVADRAANEDDIRKYKPAATPGASTTTIIYVNRVAAEIHHDLGAGGAAPTVLEPALERLFAEEEPHGAPTTLMCGDDEPGEKLEFYGRVFDEHGNPLPKAAVIAYSTDAKGLYVPRGSPGRSPRIRGVAVTDAEGWYRFRTIRPGGYPDSDDPQHIHLHIDAAVHRHTYRTLWFDDDPRLTAAKRRSIDGETKIVSLRKRGSSVLTARFDVRLEGS